MKVVDPDGAKRLWTRDFVLATVVNALVMTIFYLLMTTMAVYAVRQFAAAAVWAGLASSMFIIGAVVTRLAGGIVDAVGPRRTLLVGLAIFIAMSLAYVEADSLALLLTVRFVHGAAFGLVSTAATALAQASIPPLRRGEGTGYFAMSIPFASGIGPALALWLIDHWDYQALFLACAVVSTGAFISAFLLRPAPTTRVRWRPDRQLWRELVHPRVVPLAGFMLLIGVVNSSVITFVHSFADDLGIADAAGAFFLVQALGVLGARLVSGRIQDRRGDNMVVYPAVVLYAAGLVTLSQAGATTTVLIAGALTGAGFGTLMPAVQAAVVQLSGGQRVGLAVATYYLFLDIGTGLGPLGLGFLIEATDYRVMYLAVSALMLSSTLYYHAVHGRRREVTGSLG